MNSDIETLIRATSYTAQWDMANESGSGFLAGSVAALTSQDAAIAASEPRQGPAELAVEIKKLLEAALPAHTNVPLAALPSKTTAADTEGAETFLRTAGTMTGIGPIMSGLLKLFGSNEPEPLPQLEKFSAPPPVAVEAALTRDGQYSAVRYAQGGAPQAVGGASGATQAPAIQVNIQAMDSRSFLDRQDDIARAVREAMLHSNALNDVVMDL